MRKTSIIFLTLLLTCGLFVQGFGQEETQPEKEKKSRTTDFSKWKLGLHVSMLQFYGDMGSEFFEFKPVSGAVDLTVARILNPSFDIEGAFMGGNLDYVDNDVKLVDTKVYDLTAKVVYKFNNGYILKEEAVVSPFIFAGAGAVKSDFGYDFTAPLGVGLNFRIDEYMNFQVRSQYKWNTDADYDFFQHSAGFVFNLGKKNVDSDGDGLLDRDDACPNVAGIAAFQGCPDTDGDGIKDSEDTCPEVAGIAAFQGCPDTDGDGIQDSEDPCPTVKGVDAFKGCPDTDGDGIQDGEDKCPKVKGIVAFQGCPDTDGDGIADPEDKCPKVAGITALMGCPDADADGITDAEDKCPNEAGIAENQGCPELDEETVKVLEEALEGIQFESGKDILKAVSYEKLDNVARIMQMHPEYNLLIDGHTDSAGDDTKNMELSKRRAEMALKYLADKGIEANRMTATGYGETKPIADNSTPAGRAQNRRVEFTIKF